jgi:hypothetical protein
MPYILYRYKPLYTLNTLFFKSLIMSKIINARMVARMDKPFVVFMIGMRVNNFWKVHKWLPVAMAMPRMIKELMARPGSGFMGAESWFGRTTIMVQYWESVEKLTSYARDPSKDHYPAWIEFNKNIASNGDVGIWHETYVVQPDQYKTVYNNMPHFGLGKIGDLVSAQKYPQRIKTRPAPTEAPLADSAAPVMPE